MAEAGAAKAGGPMDETDKNIGTRALSEITRGDRTLLLQKL